MYVYIFVDIYLHIYIHTYLNTYICILEHVYRTVYRSKWIHEQFIHSNNLICIYLSGCIDINYILYTVSILPIHA